MDDTTKTNISLTTEECAVFLGRELTPNEEGNFAVFLAVAVARLNNLLNVDINTWKREADIPILQLLLARLVGVLSDEQEAVQNRGIVAKAVEDFKVEYDETASTPMRQFVEYNADLLKLFVPKPIFRAGSNAYDGKSLCI